MLKKIITPLFISFFLFIPLISIGMNIENKQDYKKVEQILQEGSTVKKYYTTQLEERSNQILKQAFCEKTNGGDTGEERIKDLLKHLNASLSEKDEPGNFSRFFTKAWNSLSFKSLDASTLSYIQKACAHQNIHPQNITIYTSPYYLGASYTFSIVLNPYVTDRDAQKAIIDHEVTHIKYGDVLVHGLLEALPKGPSLFEYQQFAEYRADVIPAIESIKKARRLAHFFCNCDSETFPWPARLRSWTSDKIWRSPNPHQTDKERCRYLTQIRNMLEIESQMRNKVQQEEKIMKRRMKTFDPINN